MGFIRKIIFPVVISAVLLTGCGSPPMELAIDDRFTPAEVNVIRDTIDEWTTAMDVDDPIVSITGTFSRDEEFRAAMWDEKENHLFRIVTSDRGYDELAKNGHYAGKFNTGSFNMLFVMDKIDNREQFRGIVLHEVGHMLGMISHTHYDSVPSIMAEGSPQAVCIHQYDIALVCSLNVCGSDSGPTCL